jgi:hypothetical protein
MSSGVRALSTPVRRSTTPLRTPSKNALLSNRWSNPSSWHRRAARLVTFAIPARLHRNAMLAATFLRAALAASCSASHAARRSPCTSCTSTSLIAASTA